MAPSSSPVPPDPAADLATPAGMTRRQFRAMGTTVSVVLDERHAGGAAVVARLFETWEEAFSRFRPGSELSRVNARAGRAVAVSSLFAEVVDAALDAARATDGIFDPGLEGQMRAIGYDRTFDDVPRSRPDDGLAAKPGGGWRSIELDRAARTIRLPRDVSLDLGGIAKGLAVDAAIAELARLGAGPAAVEAGGDAAVIGSPDGMTGWPIAIEVPGGSRAVAIPSGAIATSGISRRAWRVGEESRHHLVDPRSGRPADHSLWSVTAFAALCGQAEVAAKVAFILGPAAGTSFLLRIGVAGLLVDRDGGQVVVGQWADAADGPASDGAPAAAAADVEGAPPTSPATASFRTGSPARRQRAATVAPS